MSTSNFYLDLPGQDKSINSLLQDTSIFQAVPNDWSIIITDIKGSTKAVQAGMSELVNLVATGSIIAALNIAAKSKIDIPFFFGGDGGTLIVPPILLEETMIALILHQNNVKEEFDVDLRVGCLLVSEVYENGNTLKIAKAKINAIYAIPIILGNGLHYAEKIIKSKDSIIPAKKREDLNLDLAGMECRWNEVSPPKNTNEVVCLLITALKESEQAILFKKILDKADAIYGSHKKRNPISIPQLKLDTGFKRIGMELKMRRSNSGILGLLRNWMYIIIGKYLYLPSKTGQKYLNELVQLSDIFVMDGRINMVISGRSSQRVELVNFLDKMEANSEILYGIYVSQESIICCYVQNRALQHIHFINGGDGGYTKAAIVLKGKM